ncbi:MAG: YicC family protein [Candidatus Bipolaricaulota bacterium]|nr:YicC family protein [Candidatus Bipolaricaulota bacterium]
MTGFGRARAAQGGHAVQVDLRSLNHRFLEVRVRGLAEFPALAQRCEDRLRAAFARGALELYVRWEDGVRPKRLGLDAARQYLSDLTRLQEELGLADRPSLAHLLSLGVFAEEAPDEEELWPAVARALDGAIEAVAAAREREGATLRDALARERTLLRAALAAARRLAPQDVEGARGRIAARIAELGVAVDPARVATELVLWAERSDVQEELDRLTAHLARFEELLAAEGPVGREVEFLAQEMGREAGTLAAKARSVDLAQAAGRIRLAVERIREQARNVE